MIMPYIVNTKFNEIMNAAKNGNEKALAVMHGMRGSSQEDLDALVDAFYAVDSDNEQVIGDSPEDVSMDVTAAQGGTPEEIQPIAAPERDDSGMLQTILDAINELKARVDELYEIVSKEDSKATAVDDEISDLKCQAAYLNGRAEGLAGKTDAIVDDVAQPSVDPIEQY